MASLHFILVDDETMTKKWRTISIANIEIVFFFLFVFIAANNNLMCSTVRNEHQTMRITSCQKADEQLRTNRVHRREMENKQL